MKFISYGVNLALIFIMPLWAQEPPVLSLNDAITMALSSNPKIIAAQKEIDAAEGRILQAGRIPNPELGISWNESPSFNIGKAGERDFSISQQIEFPTKRDNRIDIALDDKSLARLQLERVKKLIAVRVKKAYYNVLLGKTILQSLEEQKKILSDLQQLITSRYKSGSSSYLDITRIKIETARLTNERAEAEREFRRKKSELALAIGSISFAEFNVNDSLIYLPMKFNRDSLIERSIMQSATLQIVQLTVERQQRVLRLMGKNYLPDFEISLANQRRAEIDGYNNNLWGIELKVSLPLWYWQEPRGLEQEASAALDIASIQLQSADRQIRAAVRTAIDAVEVLQSQLQIFDATLLKETKEAVATAIAQYQNTQTDVLTLFEMYRTHRAIASEYARTVVNYLIAVADLEASAEPFNEE